MSVPAPKLMAFVVTFVEIVGGILLIVGLFSRLAALLLTIDLVVAILLVKVNIGLLSPVDGSGVGAELDLALIAGFLVVLLAGPGRLSVDQALGYEGDLVQDTPSRGGRRRSSRRSIFSRSRFMPAYTFVLHAFTHSSGIVIEPKKRAEAIKPQPHNILVRTTT